MTPRSLRSWIIEHDDRWLFIVPYIGLAVVLSIWISLFWLIAVVAAHFALEWVRQSHLRPSGKGIFMQALWGLKLDIALVLFALALTLYMDVLLGVVGLQSAARIGAVSRSGTRFAAWERTLRGLLLSGDDAAQVARAVANRAALGIGVVCIMLILVAPWLTDHTFGSALLTMATELRAFPAGAAD